MEKTGNTISAILKKKCPNCRKGEMFTNKSIFPLKNLLKMPDHCPHCGQKMEIEIGFYYGTGYVSYAICVLLSIIIFIAYYLLLGVTWRDNSIFYYLATNVALILLLQPWIVRYSRVLYLNMFVKYKQNRYIADAFKKTHTH
jgi:uncharacterized protein (DUF983 family)